LFGRLFLIARAQQAAKHDCDYDLACHFDGPRSRSGSLAIFTAIRRASPWLSTLATERRPGSFS
jgi:hypothetical protein